MISKENLLNIICTEAVEEWADAADPIKGLPPIDTKGVYDFITEKGLEDSKGAEEEKRESNAAVLNGSEEPKDFTGE